MLANLVRNNLELLRVGCVGASALGREVLGTYRPTELHADDHAQSNITEGR